MNRRKTEQYMYGDCYLLADSIHDVTGGWHNGGWERVQRGHGQDAHALVRTPDGKLLDAEGLHEDTGDTEPFHDDLWFPLGEVCRWPDDQTRADAIKLLTELGFADAVKQVEIHDPS